jgi:hypothetical protein
MWLKYWRFLFNISISDIFFLIFAHFKNDWFHFILEDIFIWAFEFFFNRVLKKSWFAPFNIHGLRKFYGISFLVKKVGPCDIKVVSVGYSWDFAFCFNNDLIFIQNKSFIVHNNIRINFSYHRYFRILNVYHFFNFFKRVRIF